MSPLLFEGDELGVKDGGEGWKSKRSNNRVNNCPVMTLTANVNCTATTSIRQIARCGEIWVIETYLLEARSCRRVAAPKGGRVLSGGDLLHDRFATLALLMNAVARKPRALLCDAARVLGDESRRRVQQRCYGNVCLCA